MSGLRLMIAALVAVPTLATAQVGPNPAVKGGSLDPSVGPTRDPATAPDDVTVGTGPTVTVPETDNGTTAADLPPEPTVGKRTTGPSAETKRKKPR